MRPALVLASLSLLCGAAWPLCQALGWTADLAVIGGERAADGPALVHAAASLLGRGLSLVVAPGAAVGAVLAWGVAALRPVGAPPRTPPSP